MMAEGWIKLYRKITEWEWYTVPSMAHLFIHLLFLANQKSKRWKGIVIKRGQLVTSATRLAEQTGLDKRTVCKNLKRLEETEEITKTNNYHYSLITITKFDYYQSVQLCTDQCTDQCTQLKNKEYKKERIPPPPPPPAREGKSERRFFEALKGSVEMMSAMQEAFGLTTDRYWSLLASFSRECEAKDKQHTGMDDYKRHFFDWTRRHVEINGKDENRNKGKGRGSDNNQGQGEKAAANARRHGDRDSEIRGDVNNMLAKYGLTADDVGI